jgi:putative SbcD/Mre11-related phosphoesterase
VKGAERVFKASSRRSKVVESVLRAPGLLVSVGVKGYRVCDGIEIFPGGSALIKDGNVLVVADMHLGCEASLEYQGISLPRVQSREIQKYLKVMIEALEPSKVIVAGDLKHNFSRNLNQEWRDVARFVRMLSGRVPLEVVKGNHDNYLGSILKEYGIPMRSEATCAGVRIVHGHVGTLTGGPTIMGHLHPSIRLRESTGASLKSQCFLYEGEMGVLVLPALSLIASGVDVVGQSSSDTTSPLLSDVGLAGFVPIAFSGAKALKFPSVGELRRIGGRR